MGLHSFINLYRNDKKRFFSLLGIILVVLAVPLTVFIAQKQQETRQRASELPTTPPFSNNPNVPTVSLSFSPNSDSTAPNNFIDTTLLLEAGTTNISGADIVITYNPSVLEVVNFLPSGKFNSELINKIDAQAGSLHYAGTDTAGSSITGNVSVGTIRFKGKVAGGGDVQLASAQIVGVGYGGNALNVVPNNPVFTIQNPIPTVVPTAMPIATSIPTTTPIPATPTPIIPTTTPVPVPGDVNGDRTLDILDFNIWRSEFLKIVTTKQADLNKDGKIDLLDFNIWRDAFISPHATPTPIAANYKKVFITSTTYNGNLGGLAGADNKCQTRATAANLSGTWKAWLSSSLLSTNSRLTHATTAYKLVNGTIVAKNWTDLTDQILANPINVSETGQTVALPDNFWNVWTNSSTNGNVYEFNPGFTCLDWTSINATGRGGSSAESNYRWTAPEFSGHSCSSTARLYCFEQ